jgi:hypothetical protein
MLATASSTVREDGRDRRVCDTRSGVVVGLLRVGAAVAVILGVASLTLAATGRAPPAILGGAGISLLGGLALAWLARRRARLTGMFIVDRQSRSIRRTGAPGVWSFDDVAAITLVVDPTDGMRPDLLPELPHWLVATTRTGEALKLAKGGRRELSPVLSRLAEFGLPHADP